MSTPRTPRAAVLGLTVGALVAGGLVLAPAASAAPSTTIVINEVYGGGGNSGATYKNDFIELKNISAAPVSVTGWSVQYAPATGSTWQVTGLNGTIAPGGRYLVAEAAGAAGTADLPAPRTTGTINMSGTAGKVALVNNATMLNTVCGAACAGGAGVVDFVGFGTTANSFEGTGRAPAPSNTNSVSRNAAGADTDNNNADFVAGAPTPENVDVTDDPAAPRTCPTGPIAIGTIQGSGSASPCVGETVTVSGTVVGDLQDGGYRGFHVQDGGDGDDATSDAVFVFSSTPVSLGDQVTVAATVAEFEGLTELVSATATVTSSGGPLPAAAVLPLPSTTEQREALEGMLVAPASDLTVTEVFNLNRFGEILLAQGGRLISPTEAADTGGPSAAVAAQNAARSIVLDDGRTTNYSTAPAQAPPYLTVADPVRVGDTAQLQPQVLSYGFGLWRLQPADGTAEGNEFAATNPRPAAPGPVGGDLRIGDFNVLNYFVDFPSEFGDNARGATDAEELAEQQAKIVTAITALNADIITLHEIENSAVLTPETPYRAVETLLAAIEQADGHDWNYVQAHEDTDVITNAVIYRTDKATPVGAPLAYNGPEFDNARSPIGQTFRAGDETFSIIANHLKSKGSSCGAASDDTSVGGAGSCNGDRVAQAQALVAFAETVKTSSGDQDVLLTGDFNAYRYEDPIDVVTGAGYTDMGPVLADGQYSYVFDGGSGSLDHVFASPSIVAKVTGLAVWDINAVESFAYEYDSPYEGLYAPYAFRASDHNPTVFGLTTDIPATAAISDPKPLRGDRVTVTGTGFDAGTTVQATLPSRNGAVLGTGVADANGAVSITFTVPVLLTQGDYPVALTAVDGEKALTSFTLRPAYQDALLIILRFLTTHR
ncbi:ExeM/NucH family extracellular endonuclease [Blastococcus sp. CT_GayMR16]|uniref:ExeM/NucH family extracellular endonuclease n=1 Tax=Blastococcus sp. CT_GayMR16 TaxID=2559607 RepID=UPI0010730F34|nr:ExeM/NucH family extracellular endonuclease [Blastococcus sp. CT_GayMR16]TFV88539.1 ExeM/NucH family extracellular endonuclease [Blastococcus sp. CT_GayMR16]